MAKIATWSSLEVNKDPHHCILWLGDGGEPGMVAMLVIWHLPAPVSILLFGMPWAELKNNGNR